MKIAVANRGEVAVRIIQACQELGHETVLLHSEVDIQSRAYRISDESICIGPAPSTQSYLSIKNNVNAAVSVGADALHPGFGFLSENPRFAQECIDKGIIFIGPSPESIQLFGNKISAKKLVSSIGPFLIPGYEGEDQSSSRLRSECDQIGYPVVIKAADGGGGRGIRVVQKSSEFDECLAGAKREALAAFGSDRVFLEKYLDRAKHVEIQIFGESTGRVFHFGERECSIQRKHQKVIEEAPCFFIPQEMKEQMYGVAIDVAKKANYRGAGTVEFLVQDDQFYFLEMNTRLQVEHPVTEMTYQVDLVKAQILEAFQSKLPWFQDELIPRGHAIECRLYAEDPYNGGLPSLGKLGMVFFPTGAHRRFEYGFEEGDEITSFYDSMIAKVIVWDESRTRALVKMRETLEKTILFGVKTNIPYLLEILNHPDFVSGAMNTQFISKYIPNGLDKSCLTVPFEEKSLDQAYRVASKEIVNLNKNFVNQQNEHPSPWLKR